MTDAVCALAALAVAVGALVGEWAGAGDGSAALLTALLAWLLGRGGGGRRRLAAGLVAVAAVGGASMQRGLDGLGPAVPPDGIEAMVAVTLTQDPRWYGPATSWGQVGFVGRVGRGGVFQGQVVTPEAGNGRWLSHPHRPGALVAVTASGATAGRLRLLTAGEEAVVAGRFQPLDGHERRLRWRHAAAAFVADDLLAVHPARSPLMRAANPARAAVLAGTGGLPDPAASLVAGLLVGDDRGLPARLRDDFRRAGLSHLLVVSGANVAFALAVVAPLLGRLGLTGRLVGGLGVIVVFAAITRFEPSVLRASVMAGLALLAAFTGRPATGRRTLALAVVVLLVADPFLVHSTGFLLSCGASAGIVALAGPLAARLPGPPWLRCPLAVTAAAQVGVAPVALPMFGGLPLVALPANLLAAPAAAALTVWGLASSAVGAGLEALAPGLSWPLGLPTTALAGYLATVATVAARCPLTIGPVAAGGGAALAMAAWALRSWSASAAAPGRTPGRGTSARGRGS